MNTIVSNLAVIWEKKWQICVACKAFDKGDTGHKFSPSQGPIKKDII